jgi:hypothetical protein
MSKLMRKSWLHVTNTSFDTFSVWSQIVSSLANIRSVFADNEKISTALKTYTFRLVSTTTEKVGWDFEPNEDFLTGQLRALLINTAGGAGHQG